MSFCLNTCYLHLCSYVTLSQTSVIKKVCHYVLLSKHLLLRPCSYVTLSLKTHYFVFKKPVTLSFNTHTKKRGHR